MVTVLIVDDSAFDRKLAGGLLTKNSEWQVKYAEDGAKALAMLDEVLDRTIHRLGRAPNPQAHLPRGPGRRNRSPVARRR